MNKIAGGFIILIGIIGLYVGETNNPYNYNQNIRAGYSVEKEVNFPSTDICIYRSWKK